MTRYSITLDLAKYTTQLSLPCKNTDVSREIAITLHQNGVPYTLTADNYAVFVAKKTSGADIVNDCVVDLVNNCVVYTITQQTIAEIGKLPCEIQLFGYDREQIGSPTFNILVRKALLGETDIESSSEYSTLNNIINDVKTRLENGEFDGKDGINPLVRINDVTHEWEVSYDNGESWQSLDTQAEPRSVYLSSEAGLGLPYSQYKISAVTVPSGMALKNGDIIIFANSTIAKAYNVGAETYSATTAQSFKGDTGEYGYSIHYANEYRVAYEGTSEIYYVSEISNSGANPVKVNDLCVTANGTILKIIGNNSSFGWIVKPQSSIGYSVHYSSYEATSATTEIPQGSISGALNPSIKTNDICITPNGLMFRIGTKKDAFTWNVRYLSSIKGNPFRVTKTFASVAEMEADTSIPEGSFVIISTGNVEDEENARLYVRTLTGYGLITDLSGAKGIQGEQGIQGIQGAQGIPGISIRSCVFPFSGSNVEYAIGSIEAVADYPIKAGDLVIFNGEYLAVIQNVDTSKNVFSVGQRVFYIKGDKGDGVPTVTEADEGKFLRVRDGIVVAEDTRYTLNGTYAMKNEINLDSYYGFEEEVIFKIYNGAKEASKIRVEGSAIQAYVYQDYTDTYEWIGIYSRDQQYWSGGFYKLVFDDVIVSEKLYKLITENGGDAVSRELIDSVGYQVRDIDTILKNHTTILEKNTSDIAKHGVMLTNHEKRITNLEKGLPSDRFVTDDGIAYVKDVPTNALPYAAVQKIGGMCRKCTNLAKPVSTTGSGYISTLNADGSITISGASTYNGQVDITIAECNIELQVGKVYTASAIKNGVSDAVSMRVIYTDAEGGGGYSSTSVWVNKTIERPCKITRFYVQNANDSVAGDTSLNGTYTIMLNEGATALPYEAYYDGIRPAKVTAIESKGVNIWDEQWVIGSYSGYQYVRSLYIPCLPQTRYFFCSPVNASNGIQFFDKNRTSLATSTTIFANANTSFTTPEGAYFMRFNLTSSYGTEYKNDICINLWNEAINGVYYPYREPTHLNIPEAAQVENGTDANCYDYMEWSENGARFKHIKVGVVDMSTLDWSTAGSTVGNTYSAKMTNLGLPTVLAERATGILCVRYNNVAGDTTQMTDKTMMRHQSSYIYIRDTDYADAASFKAAMQGVMLYYELAEPIVTDISDILPADNLIEVEGGGTITFVNENGIAVPSTIVYQVKEG